MIELSEYFEYDPSSPSGLIWAKVPGKHRTIRIGDNVGCLMENGKWHTKLMGKQIYCHRIVWWLHGFCIPEGMWIDHKDRNPSNNKIDNLRLATKSQNCANSKLPKDNKSGFKGVRFRGKYKKWVAEYHSSGKKKHIGNFDCPVMAAEAYDRMAIKEFGEFANPNFPLVD